MLISDKIVVKLLEEVKPQDSLLVPNFENYETDGGRPASVVSKNQYLLKGIVIDFSKQAEEKLKQDGINPEKGDLVFLSPNAISPAFQYYNGDRSTSSIKWNGYIIIPYLLIDNYLKNEQQDNY